MNLTRKDEKVKISQIAEFLNAELELNGNEDLLLTRIDPIDGAADGSLSFVSNPKYLKCIETTNASAVIINKKDREQVTNCKKPLIVSKDAYHDFQKALLFFYEAKSYYFANRAKFVSISENAKIGKDNQIADFVYVGDGVEIGTGNVIYPFVFIGDNSKIGNNCIIYPNVSIMEDTVIGNSVIIQPGAVIGSDGFGFVPTSDGYYKIPQVGNVIVGDNTEIGACTTVDRAALKSTEIGVGVKIDNLCQIAHNVKIGNHTAMAAQSGISGSSTVGARCIIAGQAGLVGHISLGDGVTIGAQSGVSKSFGGNQILLGSPAKPHMEATRDYAYISKLGETHKRIKQMEKKLAEIEEMLSKSK